MEKPRIVETVKETFEGLKRRLGGFVIRELEAFDDALDVYGADDFPVEEERLVTSEELAQLDEK